MTTQNQFGFYFAVPFARDLTNYGSLILLIGLVGLLTYLVYRYARFQEIFSQKESKWMLLNILIMIPLTFIGRFVFKGQQVTTSIGTLVAAVCFPLGLIPLFSSIGLIGLLPTLLLAVVTGLLQAGMFNQDPMHSMVYAVMIISFALLIEWFKGHRRELSNRAVLSAAASALAIAVALLLIVQLINLMSVGLLTLQRWFENVFTLTIALTIAIVLGVLAALGIKYFFPEEWTPTAYLKAQKHFNSLKFTLDTIEEFINGDFDGLSKRKDLTRDEVRLIKALEKLQKQSIYSSDQQAKLLSLNPASFDKQSLDEVLDAILKASLVKDSKSARIILASQTRQMSENLPNLSWGIGELNQAYAYLDEMVLEKLGDDNQLVLSDIKVDQYFGLSAENPFPQSLIALNLNGDGQSIGTFWVGFEKTHWFNREEINFYEALASRIEAALALKQQKFQVSVDRDRLTAAFDAIDDPVIMLDENNSIYYLNRSAERLSEVEKSLLRGSGSRKVIGLPELQMLINDRSYQPHGRLIEVGQGKEYEATVRTFSSANNQRNKLITLRDTSWIKKISQQKSEFVTNISHDLRSPLNMMKGYVSLLGNIGNLSEEQLKYVSRIQGTIENMTRLISKVISLEQLDNEDPLHYSIFEIKELIEEAVQEVSLTAQQKRVTINNDLRGLRSKTLSADRVMLHQAVYNLLENAVKFSNRGGVVDVMAETDEANLHIAVQDRGIGVAPLDQPKLFTRFFHVDDDNHLGSGGQGLGLAIVKSIAVKHGGDVTVRSQLGEGSTFYLKIPLRRTG